VFLKKRESNQTMNFHEGIGVLNVKGCGLANQIEMIHLTTDDLKIMNKLQPFILEEIEMIVDSFYGNLIHEPSLIDTINTYSSVEKLRKTLQQHIIEIFAGIIDETYLETRIRIAKVHVRIGLQTKWYMSAFQELFLLVLTILEKKSKIRMSGFLL